MLLASLRAWFIPVQLLVDAIRAARKSPPPPAMDSLPVVVPERFGPVVESRDLKTPMPLVAVPARSTKGDAKRHAKRVVEGIEGKPVPWKKARKTIKKLARDPEAKARDVADPKKRSTLPPDGAA
jgi:hypothetical protein